MRIHERTLYRVALALLTAALILVSIVRLPTAYELREAKKELGYWRYVDETNKLLKQWLTDEKLQVRRLEQEVELLKAENADLCEGLDATRKPDKSRE